MATYKQILDIIERATIDKDTQFDGVGLSYTTCNNIARMYGVNNQNGIGVSGRPHEIEWLMNETENLSALSDYFSRKTEIEDTLKKLSRQDHLGCLISSSSLKLKVIEWHFKILHNIGLLDSPDRLEHDTVWRVMDKTTSVLWVNKDGVVKSMSRLLQFDSKGRRYRFNIDGVKISMGNKKLIEWFWNR